MKAGASLLIGLLSGNYARGFLDVNIFKGIYY